MPRWIDHEAMAPGIVFGGRHEKPALPLGTPITTDSCSAFDEAGPMSGVDRRNDDPVAGMIAPELTRVLAVGFFCFQDDAIDLLIGVGFTMPQCLVGAAPLIIREELREGYGDLGPLRIFLVPAAGVAIGRMNESVALVVEMEAAMRGGRMTDDTLIGTPEKSAPRPMELERSS